MYTSSAVNPGGWGTGTHTYSGYGCGSRPPRYVKHKPPYAKYKSPVIKGMYLCKKEP